MITLTGTDIATTIQLACPTQIAVAYLGKDWGDFISDPTLLDYVILSPSIGTNPQAVLDLIRVIGWEKVLFLDELHAKVYLGDAVAVVGSANLTNNGLSGEVLIEMCMQVTVAAEVDRIRNRMDAWRTLAKLRYPSEAHKKKKLAELIRLHAAAIANRLLAAPKSISVNFADFALMANDEFYVCWYQESDVPYSDEAKSIQSQIANELHFASEDRIKPYTWVLCWPITNDDLPDPRRRPSWMFIHQVLSGGIVKKGYEYPQLAVQLRKPTGGEPFHLSKGVIDAFRRSVAMPAIAQYFIQPGIFSLKHSERGLPLLLKQMRRIMGLNVR